MQVSLNYIDTESMVRQRNKSFFQSHWLIVNLEIKKLYQEFVNNYPEDVVFKMKPF